MLPQQMSRDEVVTTASPPPPSCLLASTAACCDLASLTCALPCLCILAPCTGGPYAPEWPPPPHTASGMDRWYRAAIHTLHGGSLLQLLATHMAYWRFPKVRNEAGYALHGVEVAPRTACGALCFVPLVRAAEPQFRIHTAPDGVLSVRLNARLCGTGPHRMCPGATLNDVWRVSSDGRMIRSVKTRSHCVVGDDVCVTGTGTGPALCVAADELATERQVRVALRSRH